MTTTKPKEKSFQEIDWASRYGPKWNSISRKTEKLQMRNGKVVCAWCGEEFDPSETQTHHVRYSRDGETLLQDGVVPHEDIFNVCGKKDQEGTCHYDLHSEALWYHDKENPLVRDCNYESVRQQLVENYRQFQAHPTEEKDNDMANTNAKGWTTNPQGGGNQRNGSGRTRQNHEQSFYRTYDRPEGDERNSQQVGTSKRFSLPRGGWGMLKYPVYGAAGLLGAWMLLRSFGIYDSVFKAWGLGTAGAVCNAFNPVPFIGDWLAGGCNTIASLTIGLVAFITLIALTSLMSIPVFVMFVPAAISGMIDQLRHNNKAHQALRSEHGDTPEVQGLIKRHEELPRQALRTLMGLSLVAFGLEMFIVWTFRGGQASLMTCLIDSLGFEALLLVVFVFRMAFIPGAKRSARSL